MRFCPATDLLDPSDCQKCNIFFPSDRLFLGSQVDSDYSSRQAQNNNRIHITKDGLDPDEISRISSQVAARGMSRVRQRKKVNEKDKQKLMDRLGINDRGKNRNDLNHDLS